MSLRWALRPAGVIAALASICLSLAACSGHGGAHAEDPVADATNISGPQTIVVPYDAPTIQAAVDKAAPGDIVEVAPGTYHQSIQITTPDITLRGSVRNEVVLDGQDKLSNGIVVTAPGVTVEDMTVHDYTLNGVLVTGISDATGGIAEGSPGFAFPPDPVIDKPMDGFAVRYITAYNNGLNGIYAYDVRDGIVEQNYASGSGATGIKVGQCTDCDLVVRSNVAERNAVGYAETVTDGVITYGNRFSSNRVGATLASDPQQAFTPQHGASFVGNVVADNGDPQTPGPAHGYYGYGVIIFGGTNDLVQRNVITGNGAVGVVVTSRDEMAPIGNRVVSNTIDNNGQFADVSSVPGLGPPGSSDGPTDSTTPIPVSTNTSSPELGPPIFGGDLAYTASEQSPGQGNCAQDNSGSYVTLPATLPSDWKCPKGNATAVGIALPRIPVPPAVPVSKVLAPPVQPTMPAKVLREDAKAPKINTYELNTPSPNLLINRTLAYITLLAVPATPSSTPGS